MSKNNNNDWAGIVGCLAVISIIFFILTVVILIIAGLSWLICLAFGLSWSWMLAVGICAIIALLWVIKAILF